MNWNSADVCPLARPQMSAELRYHDRVSTYYVQNFGCRATQADGAAIERQFKARGLVPASADQAGLIILNTCTVTNSADQDARAAIRRLQRQNPLARVIVTGCYAQRAPQEIAALPGVDAVIGNSHKALVAETAAGFSAQPPPQSQGAGRLREPLLLLHHSRNARTQPLGFPRSLPRERGTFCEPWR